MITNIKNFLWLLDVSFKQILRIDSFRFFVCYLRFIYFFIVKRNFKTFYPMDYVSEEIPGSKKEKISSVAYNASYRKLKDLFEIFNQFSGHRSQRLVTALSICFSGVEGLRNKKCLSIGPRTEAELFSLVSHGAKFKDIASIELQSYSPKILPADITNIPFNSNTFDCVIAGWVLPYVAKKNEAVAEIIRVCKNGAFVAVAHSWYPESDTLSNGDFTNGQNVTHGEEILKLFENNIQCVVVNYDQSKINPDQRGDLIAVLKIRKFLE